MSFTHPTKASFYAARLNGPLGSKCCGKFLSKNEPKNHGASREEDKERHRDVRNVIGRTLVPDAHHGASAAVAQKLHERVTYLVKKENFNLCLNLIVITHFRHICSDFN